MMHQVTEPTDGKTGAQVCRDHGCGHRLALVPSNGTAAVHPARPTDVEGFAGLVADEEQQQGMAVRRQFSV